MRFVFATCLMMLIGAVSASAQHLSVDPPTSQPDFEEFTVDLVLDPEGATIMGMEISLAFDHLVVRLDGIDAGPWFTVSAPDYFFWDYTHPGTELIHFSGASLGVGQDIGGVIATCHFTALQGGISPVNFLGTDLRDPENNMIPVTHTTGDLIVIDDAVATDAVAWDRVKALYRR